MLPQKMIVGVQDVVVQLLSCVQLFVTPWTAAYQAFLSFTISWTLLKLMSIEWVMPCNILFSVAPFSSCLQSVPASGSFPMSSLFASGGQSIGASASALVPPMNKQDWFFQYYSLKERILPCSDFFRVQYSRQHITTGKTIALTTWTFVDKVMYLLFNMCLSLS